MAYVFCPLYFVLCDFNYFFTSLRWNVYRFDVRLLLSPFDGAGIRRCSRCTLSAPPNGEETMNGNSIYKHRTPPE